MSESTIASSDESRRASAARAFGQSSPGASGGDGGATPGGGAGKLRGGGKGGGGPGGGGNGDGGGDGFGQLFIISSVTAEPTERYEASDAAFSTALTTSSAFARHFGPTSSQAPAGGDGAATRSASRASRLPCTDDES